jgi:hypothetical protein
MGNARYRDPEDDENDAATARDLGLEPLPQDEFAGVPEVFSRDNQHLDPARGRNGAALRTVYSRPQEMDVPLHAHGSGGAVYVSEEQQGDQYSEGHSESDHLRTAFSNVHAGHGQGWNRPAPASYTVFEDEPMSQDVFGRHIGRPYQ